MGHRYNQDDPDFSTLDRRIRRALSVLDEYGIAAYRCVCEACGAVDPCPHPRAWTLGRPDASYRVDDERLVRHAKAALKLAGLPRDPLLE